MSILFFITSISSTQSCDENQIHNFKNMKTLSTENYLLVFIKKMLRHWKLKRILRFYRLPHHENCSEIQNRSWYRTHSRVCDLFRRRVFPIPIENKMEFSLSIFYLFYYYYLFSIPVLKLSLDSFNEFMQKYTILL